MTFAEEYGNLKTRLAKLSETRAVLLDRETKKAERRRELEAELLAAGIDPADLDKAERELTAKLIEELAQAKALLDEFEARLKAIEDPSTIVQSPSVVDVDLA